jgi:hypothetical protein
MNRPPPQRTNWLPPLEKKKREGMGSAREDSEKTSNGK